MTLQQSFEHTINTVTCLTNVTQKDFDLLREKSTEILEWKDEIVSLFYNTLYNCSDTENVFKEGERTEREKMLLNWLAQLVQVENPETFWKIQGKIAFAHVKRHVKNEFMVSIAAILQSYFWQKSITTFGSEKGIEVGAAFTRIINTVVGITVSLYDLIIAEITGASPELISNLIETSIDDIQKEFA